MVSELYRDYDAVPLRPRKGERGAAVNHVKKGAARKRGLEVVFDPKAHRDFVTGFRKRKQQRRKEAVKQNERKAKETRVQERAERRKELKAKLGLPENYGVEESDSDRDAPDPAALAARARVTQYQQGCVTTTVSVAPLQLGDSDIDSGSDEDDGGDAAPSLGRCQQPAGLFAAAPGRAQSGKPQHSQQKQRQGGKEKNRKESGKKKKKKRKK